MYSLTAVVPFYNEQLFLKKSLDRLLDNDVFDQIILTDDCSTDSSPEIAKIYEEKNEKRFPILEMKQMEEKVLL